MPVDGTCANEVSGVKAGIRAAEHAARARGRRRTGGTQCGKGGGDAGLDGHPEDIPNTCCARRMSLS